ncbi:MAG TPA: hypothetical protein VMV00_03190 [Candidatus Baltobacteraceae bacterium]|nr:hypothetical protein [Candidatus Baltobacteraceae bacterium]
MRESAALICLVLVSVASGMVMALPGNYYSSGSAANHTTSVVSITFTGGGVCSANLSSAASDSSSGNSSDSQYCEVGVGGNTTGAYPLWVLVPAFAGTSILGINSLGASAQGYPMYAGNIVSTECGPGGTLTACPGHPEYAYSPIFTALEQQLGVHNGIFGIPEGVVPVPAHTHANGYDYLGSSGRWYIIPVFVMDPNIMPDYTTGACADLAASNLTYPMGNCLTSFNAITRAINTTSSAVPAANGHNPIWTMLDNTTLQVVVPGITPGIRIVDENGQPISFSANQLNYYAGTPINTSAINVPSESGSQPSAGPGTTQIAIVLMAAILIAGGILALERRRLRSAGA